MEVANKCWVWMDLEEGSYEGRVLLKPQVAGFRPWPEMWARPDFGEYPTSQDFVCWFVFKEGEFTLIGVKSIDLAVVCIWGHWAWLLQQDYNWDWFRGCCKEFNCRRQWQPTPVLLPGKSQGQKNLVGCSPWGREESDTTEQLHFHFSLSCIGEGNGNPLQCSCLENPRDGGAWWAAVYGVTELDTTEAT